MRITAVLAVLSLLATIPAGAQPSPRDADAWRTMVGALQPGTFVSVRTEDGRRIRGTLVQAAEDGFLVKPKTRLSSPMRRIAYSEIDELERAKPGMSPGLKVVLGAGIGAGAMLLVGTIIIALVGD